MEALTTEYNNNIAIIKFDLIGEKVNVLRAEFALQLEEIINELKKNTSLKGVIFISGKEDNFIAGADINMIANCDTIDKAKDLSLTCQRVFEQLAKFHVPVVSAINGACLGGGLELALACHMRICTDSNKTILGLPEVQLGLLPGGGGTQRLIPLTGLINGLDIILSGKKLNAKKALVQGLVDKVVPKELLLDEAIKCVLTPKIRKNRAWRRFLENNPLIRHLILKKVTKKILTLTKGKYPAPIKIIETVRHGLEYGIEKGLSLEAQNFAELALSKESFSLRRIFLTSTKLKNTQVKGAKTSSLFVIGAGFMGSGIAAVSAKSNLKVRMKDTSDEGLAKSISTINKIISFRKKEDEITRIMDNVSATTNYNELKKFDMVIEAVFEDLSLKQNIVNDIYTYGNKDTIFASNTSSIPLHQIAKNAKYPDKIIGLHYFSPVARMPLVEVIVHELTSEDTKNRALALVQQQGKTAIIVKDKAGFYINRILAPYMHEAFNLLLKGYSIESIDNAMVDFGFPIGPLALLDEVGLDVVAKITPILTKELGEKFEPNPLFLKLLSRNFYGRKTNRGFYCYDKKEKYTDNSIYEFLGLSTPDPIKKPDHTSMLYLMLNEAVCCLDEKVIESADDGDIGAIFGIGFPPFLGGPFCYMQQIGLNTILDQMQILEKDNGSNFTPSTLLLQKVKDSSSFI